MDVGIGSHCKADVGRTQVVVQTKTYDGEADGSVVEGSISNSYQGTTKSTHREMDTDDTIPNAKHVQCESGIIMRSDEETKRKWRRLAYGKLLVGTALIIQNCVFSAENRYEFEQAAPGNLSRVMTKKELKVFTTIMSDIKRGTRRLCVLGWHMQGKKRPQGYEI